eukprot:IDg2792t1
MCDGPAIKSLRAVNILRQCSKIDDTCGKSHMCPMYRTREETALPDLVSRINFRLSGSKNTESVVRDNEAVSIYAAISGAALSIAESMMLPDSDRYKRRPMGIQKMKRLKKLGRREGVLSEIAAALTESAKRK